RYCPIELTRDATDIRQRFLVFVGRHPILERIDTRRPLSADAGIIPDAVAQRQHDDQLVARGQCGKPASEFRIVVEGRHSLRVFDDFRCGSCKPQKYRPYNVRRLIAKNTEREMAVSAFRFTLAVAYPDRAADVCCRSSPVAPLKQIAAVIFWSVACRSAKTYSRGCISRSQAKTL